MKRFDTDIMGDPLNAKERVARRDTRFSLEDFPDINNGGQGRVLNDQKVLLRSDSSFEEEEFLVEEEELYYPNAEESETQTLVHKQARSVTNFDDENGGEIQPLSIPNAYRELYSWVWNFMFAVLAAAISYLFPTYYLDDAINLTCLFQNTVGSMIAAFCTALLPIKSQYYHTYLVYEAIKGGFCSAFTTWGNFIDDTNVLILRGFVWWWPLEFFGTLGLAFLANQFGRVIALRIKIGTKFSPDLLQMEDYDVRMRYEFDVSMRDKDKEFEGVAGEKRKDKKILDTGVSNHDLIHLQKHVKLQRKKYDRHQTPYLVMRHYVIIIIIFFVTIASFLVAFFLADIDVWLIRVTLTVSGALTGKFLGSFSNDSKRSVQWGIIRTNVVSSILIAFCHNLLTFDFYFPFKRFTGKYYEIVIMSFMLDFCGSESSFAELIDSTSILFNSRVALRVPVRNLLYNVLASTIIFITITFSVRFFLLYI